MAGVQSETERIAVRGENPEILSSRFLRYRTIMTRGQNLVPTVSWLGDSRV